MKTIKIIEKGEVQEMIESNLFSFKNYVLKELNEQRQRIIELDRVMKHLKDLVELKNLKIKGMKNEK